MSIRRMQFRREELQEHGSALDDDNGRGTEVECFADIAEQRSTYAIDRVVWTVHDGFANRSEAVIGIELHLCCSREAYSARL